jgi:hypothetical protein
MVWHAARASRTKSFGVRSRTAYHETGHAVLSAAIANTPEHVSIRPERDTLGRSVRESLLTRPHACRFTSRGMLPSISLRVVVHGNSSERWASRSSLGPIRHFGPPSRARSTTTGTARSLRSFEWRFRE